MSALLVDSAPDAGAAGTDAGSAAPGPAAGQAPSEAARACSKCGAPLSPGQDWCLQCGAGAPGSLSSGGWRSGAAILVGALLLALLAAGAAVAALSKGTTHTTTIAAVARVPSTTAPITPAVPTTPTTPALTTTPAPTTTVPVPKVPVTPTVPKAATTTATTPATNTTTTSKETEAESSESKTSAILLDTNAATTYNPYNYPASGFGDPSLTIDGDTSTAWTAEVEPDKAPKMAVGVVLDLGQSEKLSQAVLISSTPGMRIQLYGATTKTPPNSITDPAWVPLSHSLVTSKKNTKIQLLSKTKAFRLVVLWISSAPKSSVGTEQAPGHVAVNEIELFPAS